MSIWPTKRRETRRGRRREQGTSLIEVAIAMLLLIFGLVAVMGLVPLAIQSNMRNRVDSTSVVIGQRLLDQMLSQPLDGTQFVNADGQVIRMGTPTTGISGGPMMTIGNRARIDFTGTATPNYSFQYTDVNDVRRPIYDVRWAVITMASGGQPIAKRYIVGVWMSNARNEMPVTLEGMVQR